jgi:predicted  nucleic acid-binding Zn-ribbon protein
VHPDLEALLAVQRHDEVIRDIERQKDSLAPRLASLNSARKRVEDEITRTEATLARETERHRALEARIVEHRSRHEKNVEILNHAHRLKEATAAAAQVETARRVLAEEESELLALNRRIIDLRAALNAARESLVDLQSTQAEERAALESEAASIDGTIREAMAVRNEAARAVPAPLLSKYERVNSRRRTQVVFALRNFSCGNCDTSISMQRRPAMQVSHQIEVCEQCGVLLYLEQPKAVEASAPTG